MASNKRTLVKKKKGGCLPGEVWNWFVKGNEVSAKGYYSATCSFCDHQWTTAKPSKLRTHLAYEYNDTASASITANKKQKLENSVNIDSKFENVPTSLNKEEQINRILLKMFLCCNLPFVLVEHPFFQEYTKALHGTYALPSR
ncbi:2638_t:CDS:2 [Cetraspora pellucida]|uniref:2638_t:CDS:1 n=1 Tax=Cetraspora pellucida TaxID=1433469 RepID=A0A9N9D4U4_9GLOM|nr:2638_t:CDS:2 [Cetraspora pellucida]